jgi:hypothetical protein
MSNVLEGSTRGLNEVPSQRLPGGTEEQYGKTVTADLSAKIRTEHRPKQVNRVTHHENLFGVVSNYSIIFVVEISFM